MDDYANDQSTTATITIGTSISGNIESEGDEDWFKVSLTGGETYLIELLGLQENIGTLREGRFYLYDANGGLISIGVSSSFTKTAFTPEQSGDYYISVQPLHDYNTGTYTLNTELANFDDQFGNNSLSATKISVGEFISSSLEYSGDQDWLEFDLIAGKTYIFHLGNSKNAGGTLGSQGAAAFTLYESGGELIESKVILNENSSFPHMVYTPDVSGSYYISIHGLFGNEAGSYTFNSYQSPFIDDHFDSPELGTYLPLGQLAQGEMEIPGDRDFFEVNFVADTSYKIELTSQLLGQPGFSVLPVIVLDFDFNQIGVALFSNAGISVPGSGPWASDEFIIQAENSGNYYVFVEGVLTNRPGDYQLSITAKTDDNSNHPVEGALFLYGDAVVGRTLLAGTRAISDADGVGAFSYQWLRDGEEIEQATSASYLLSGEDVGKSINAKVSYLDWNGHEESILGESRLVSEPTSGFTTELIEMYVIILGRAPAQDGMNFWTNVITDRHDFTYVASEMWNSAGAREHYPAELTTEEVVTSVYVNILMREPKEAGLNYWVGQWEENGPVTTMLEMISALSANNSSDPLAILDKAMFQSKVDIGGYLSITVGNSDLGLAKDAFNYLESRHSVTETRSYIDDAMIVIGQAQADAGEGILV